MHKRVIALIICTALISGCTQKRDIVLPEIAPAPNDYVLEVWELIDNKPTLVDHVLFKMYDTIPAVNQQPTQVFDEGGSKSYLRFRAHSIVDVHYSSNIKTARKMRPAGEGERELQQGFHRRSFTSSALLRFPQKNRILGADPITKKLLAAIPRADNRIVIGASVASLDGKRVVSAFAIKRAK